MANEPQASPEEIANGVDLVRLIHDEFGTDTTVVRMQIAAGDVYIDHKKWFGKDKFVIPYDEIADKIIVVIGPDRKWRLRYNG